MRAVITVAVLVIACPSAHGLATPLSITVGVGRGAQADILLKNAEGKGVYRLVVDKTGTLTAGKPLVVVIEMAEGLC